jgi:hypothetical protein
MHLVPEVMSDHGVALSRMYGSVNLNSCLKPAQQEPVIISQVSRPVGIAINLTHVSGTIPIDGVQGSVEMPRCAVAVTFTSSSDLCMQPAASAHSSSIPSVPVNSYSDVNSCQFNFDQGKPLLLYTGIGDLLSNRSQQLFGYQSTSLHDMMAL